MFADRIKELRKERNMTQVDLAKALGVSTGTVAMWETGKRNPSFDMLNTLSDLFDKRIDYILGTSDDARSPKLTEAEIEQFGEWTVQQDYEDMLRKYALLDDYGRAAVDAVLRAEFNRCQEQGTILGGISIAVSVRSKQVKEHNSL